MMGANILRCEGLVKSFGGVHALAGLGMSFPPSGVVAIIGPNGAGKTTLLNILSGVISPDDGRFFLNGKNLTGLLPYEITRHGIARTFQDVRLVSQLTVLENVMLAMPRQKNERLLVTLLGIGVAKEETRNRNTALGLLRGAELEAQADKMAGDLSYGQQKLLSLICCMATEAQVLLFDEPVAGVHPEMIKLILGLLRRLRGLEKLVIFIEHDISTVRQLADVVIVMDQGRIMAQGGIEVLDRPEIIDAYVG